MSTNLLAMLTRNSRDLIVGIDHDTQEVWLYSGEIVDGKSTADDNAVRANFWTAQGFMLGSAA